MTEFVILGDLYGSFVLLIDVSIAILIVNVPELQMFLL